MIKSPVKKFREALGLSQNKFAMLVGCSTSFLYKLESGMNNVSPRILCELTNIDPVAADGIVDKQKEYMAQKRSQLKMQIETLSKKN
jgi:transcriptional regulator with XRE-family HTH domain